MTLSSAARTFGLEEEFMLVDPQTLMQRHDAEAVLAQLKATPAAHEFLASQIEHASPVFSDVPTALAELTAFRKALQVTANSQGLAVYRAGMPFQAADYPTLTDDPRYGRVLEGFREVIADHQVNGLHVHVAIPDREVGVAVLGRLRPWLPTLLALSGNSPFWRGVDTGFASWRTIMLRRWVTEGCPPEFADAEDYNRRVAQLVGIGGTVDIETVAWNLRLSEHYPTIEFRVFDAQLDAADSVLLAAIARGLVDRAVTDEGMPSAHPELLDAALWHAARDGLTDHLVDTATGELVTARRAVEMLVDYAAHSDSDERFVREQLDRVWAEGNGAMRQRAAFAENGLAGLSALTA